MPSYQAQVQKSRRAAGMEAVMECAAIQERRFTMRSTYDTSACGSVNTNTPNYAIVVTATDSSGNVCTTTGCVDFSVTATATAAQASDLECNTLSLNALGAKTSRKSGSSTDNATGVCWRK